MRLKNQLRLKKIVSKLLKFLFLFFFFIVIRIFAFVDNQKLVLTVRGVSLSVELAVSEMNRQQGLMYRYKMDPNSGMLFVFDSSNHLTFWMKNTYISLDILFLNENFVVKHIDTFTTPLSLKPIHSKFPAKYVLEVPAGFVLNNGVRIGDEILLNIDE